MMKRKTRRKILIWSYVILAVVILLLIGSSIKLNSVISTYDTAYGDLQSLSGLGNYGSDHVHADFAVFVNGQEFDFDKPEYILVHPWTHIDPGTDNVHVIHSHATGITYGQFFSTIGIDLGDCLTINDKEFCNKNGRVGTYYLNGKIIPTLAFEEVSDLDKVLITYGSESVAEVQSQHEAVGSRSCVQSNNC